MTSKKTTKARAGEDATRPRHERRPWVKPVLEKTSLNQLTRKSGPPNDANHGFSVVS